MDGASFYKTLEIYAPLVIPVDSTSRAVWASASITNRFKLEQTDVIIRSIMETSMDYRVLCEYTAFLALESEMDSLNIPGSSPFGGGTQVAVFESEVTEFYFASFPNPFILNIAWRKGTITNRAMMAIRFNLPV